MAEVWNDLCAFAKKKAYVCCLLLVMVLSFISLLHNPTVGIDDTSFDVYYEEGVSPAMGRWCLFLINKIFPLSYNPYFVETVGLLIFCVSITLWCVAMKRLFADSVSDGAYTAFSCVMVSSPILSEVVVWYLQDGIYLGHGFTALAVLFTMMALRKGNSPKKTCLNMAASAALLTVALGFYEAFMIVYLVGMFAVFLTLRMLQREDYSVRIRDWLVCLPGIGLATVLLRTLITNGMIAFFQLDTQTKVLKSRGIHEVFAWFDGTKSLQDFTYMLKQFFVKYYINAVVYVPIRILVLAVLVLVFMAIVWSVRRRDGWIFASVCGMLISPWILAVLEGVATYYRSSQYIPFLTAFAVLLLFWQYKQSQQRSWYRGVGCFLLLVLLYNQAFEMNKWLYVDAMKYENDKQILAEVAHELMENYDYSKPICVIGQYTTPESLTEDAYCPEWSKKYTIVKFLVGILDEDIFEEYNTPHGYVFAETPLLSFITWGSTAFYGFDRELIKFWEMHGYSVNEDGNQEHYVEAKKLMKDGPVWPEEGSIVELDDHIIVNFGEKENVSD